MLVTWVVYIDVKLAKEHHKLLSLRVLFPILVHHRLLEEVLRPNGWHLGSAALPLCLDEHLAFDVCIVAKLLLSLLLLLLEFHFLLLRLRQLSIGLIRLSNELFRNFAILIGHLAERHFLDERRGARKGFDVLTGHFYFNDVHGGLTETVAEDEHDFDRAGYSEYVHLEDLFHREVKIRPADRHLERLGHLPIVNQQDGVHLQLFNASLAALFRARQVFLWCWGVVILEVKRLVDLPSLVSLLVYLQVDVGCREGSSLLQDFLPDFIHFVRHLIHFVLFLIKTSLHLFLSLNQEGDFLFRNSFLLGHL